MSTPQLPIDVDPTKLPSTNVEAEQLKSAMAEREEMLALAAHELRNPLHALALQMSLARVLAESTQHREVADRVAKAEAALRRYAERITVLLELLVSPIACYPMSARQVDLSDLLRATADGLGEEARTHGVKLRVEAPDRCPAWIDPVVVEQVIDNLLLNAFKHAAASVVTVRLDGQGQTARIDVEDNGRGIAIEDQVRIFGKFERASHSRGASGRGLGLWIIKRLTETMCGTIELNSSPGEGSVFTVRFPLRQVTSSSKP